MPVRYQIGIWKHWFLRRRGNRSTRRKTSQSREVNQQQTQPTYDTGRQALSPLRHPSSTAKVLVNCLEQNPDSRDSQNNNYNDNVAQCIMIL